LNFQEEYKYADNCSVDHRCLALEGNMSAFPENTSAGRMEMLSKHIIQALALLKPDFPLMYKGYESKLAEYDKSNLYDQIPKDSVIIETVPKYSLGLGYNSVNANNKMYVIYKEIASNMVDYIEISTFTKGSDGFGFKNIQKNTHLLNKDTFVMGGTGFTQSSIETEPGVYCLGTNANMAVMTMTGTVEDSFIISKSLANKLTTYSIYTDEFDIPFYYHPLYIYDSNEYKFMPDIGETINDDGILCAFRQSNGYTFMSDTLDTNIGNVSPFHDTTIKAPPGATILDIDIWKNPVAKSKTNYDNDKLFSQLDKYISGSIRRHKSIVMIYEKYKNKFSFSPKFETLVFNSYKYLISSKTRLNDLANKTIGGKSLKSYYIRIKVTYGIEVSPTLGFKLTGRDGGKGTVSVIMDDEDMPIDDNGIRADLVISPVGIPSRMNSGMLNEQFINRTSEFVRRRLESGEKGYNYLIDYLGKINPNYAKLINDICNTEENQIEYVRECINNGIYINLPPFMQGLTDDIFLQLEEEYGSYSTPVEFNIIEEDGSKKKERTKLPICIGSKYIYLLYAKPEPTSPGFGYVSHFGHPIRPNKRATSESFLKMTPVKVIGQDEMRLLEAGDKTGEVSRIFNLHANSPVGINKLMETLLYSKKPSAIKRVDISNDELFKTNTILKMANIFFKTAGIDINSTRILGYSDDDLISLLNKIKEEV
jgi:DNA-directed RNA polymerase beta subunit